MDSKTLSRSIARQTKKVEELRSRTAAAGTLDATEAFMLELDTATDRLESLHRMHDSALVRERFNG